MSASGNHDSCLGYGWMPLLRCHRHACAATLRAGPRRLDPPARDGFVLPLAALVSLLILLGSLSLQSLSLQGQARGEALGQMAIAEDLLASAAQVLVAEIQLHHPCLLALPQEQWAGAGCVSPMDLAQLGDGEVLGAAWHLVRWQPQATVVAPIPQKAVDLQIELSASRISPPRRSAFLLRLAGEPWRVRDLVPLGLRAGLP